MQLNPFAKNGLFNNPGKFLEETSDALFGKVIDPTLGRALDATGRVLDTPIIKFNSEKLGIHANVTPAGILGALIVGQSLSGIYQAEQIATITQATSIGSAVKPALSSGAQYPAAWDGGTGNVNLDGAVAVNQNVVPSDLGAGTANLPAGEAANLAYVAPPNRGGISSELGGVAVGASGADVAWYNRPGAVAESTGTAQAVADTSSFMSNLGSGAIGIVSGGLAAGAAVLRTIATDPNAARVAVGVGAGLLGEAIKSNEPPSARLAQSISDNPIPWIVGAGLVLLLLRGK